MSNLAKLLSRGNALVQQGDLAGARAELEKAARDHLRSADPWISLAAVHGMSGDYKNALRCARKAADLAPKSLQAWMNLAQAAQFCGDAGQAAEAYGRARGLPGCPTDVNLHLGLMLVQMGKWLSALPVLREYLACNPTHREATLALGKVLSRQGEFDEAIATVDAWCRLYPRDIAALTQLGMNYLQTGRCEDAWRTCDLATEAAPDDPDTLSFRAALMMFDGRYNEARDLYERLVQLQQAQPDSRLFVLTAQACRQAGDPNAGVAYARAAVKLDPSNLPALTTLCMGLLTNDLAEARKWMEQAVALAPDDPDVMTLKGAVLEFEGDKQGAWECVQAAIETGSVNSGAANVAAAVAPAVGKTEEAITLLEGLVDRPEISVGDRRGLHFTLARLCDRAKQYRRGFEHAVIANRLKNAWYDHNSYRVDLERLKTVFSKPMIGALPRSRIHSELPVFIVGMPRSGTSLMEQILSCHSLVHARGETTDVGDLVATIPYYPDGLRNISQEKLDALADAYLKRLREMAPSATRVTDKMPGNYVFAGVISQVFPGARIIHCRRDPRDVCLSNFMIEFRHGHTHTYDLDTLAQVCKSYQELMTYWKTVLPIPMLDVRYEDLVADPRTWVGKVLDFCGLDWEDACLNFHESQRQVVTASYDQVRQPLYTKSVARWKHYERQLEPVSQILGLYGDSYP